MSIRIYCLAIRFSIIKLIRMIFKPIKPIIMPRTPHSPVLEYTTPPRSGLMTKPTLLLERAVPIFVKISLDDWIAILLTLTYPLC